MEQDENLLIALPPWEALLKKIVWQQKMVDVEMRVAEIKEYQEIAFFRHLLLKKQT